MPSLRDLFITLVVFGSMPIILARPYVGVLVWSWLGYMNPHRLSWGFAYDFPFAYWIAIVTLVATVFSREPKRIPVTGLTIVWILFIAWMGVTTVFALYPGEAWVQYEKVLKIQLMTFATILLMCSRQRIEMLIWVIVLSLGFYGIKGGVFTIINGGEFRVYGPAESFVEGNNEIALALLMILPLMYYLRATSRHRWIRHGLLVAMGLCALSSVGSHSRGALVGGLAMAFFLWLKSKGKLVTATVLIVVVSALFAFMPEAWHERMWTIETYQEDNSAMGRIQTWEMAFNLANNRPLGGGFELWSAEVFAKYSPIEKVANDAHSIYFKVLAEHGWVGLILFLGIGIIAWRTGNWIVRESKDREGIKWLSDLARMIQVSIAAFATGGAFLGLSYFDLYWHLVAMLVLGKQLVLQHQAESGRDTAGLRYAAPQYGGIAGLEASPNLTGDGKSAR